MSTDPRVKKRGRVWGWARRGGGGVGGTIIVTHAAKKPPPSKPYPVLHYETLCERRRQTVDTELVRVRTGGGHIFCRKQFFQVAPFPPCPPKKYGK